MISKIDLESTKDRLSNIKRVKSDPKLNYLRIEYLINSIFVKIKDLESLVVNKHQTNKSKIQLLVLRI